MEVTENEPKKEIKEELPDVHVDKEILPAEEAYLNDTKLYHVRGL